MSYQFDIENGHVIGSKGKPVGTFCTDHYVDIRCRGRYVGKAHRMIWESVNGPIPKGMEVNHRNSIRWDNRIENLELVTKSENAKHGYSHGLRRADGKHNGRYKEGRYVRL